MTSTARLNEIATELGFTDLSQQLQMIASRDSQENCPLMIPLVGEFSSGKTTLINALTDSKTLETATKPTTATIYEIHFGADSCHAKVTDAEGHETIINDMADLKNDTLKDVKVVTVFDTATKVPSTTILVDTPGLSSPDPKHKQTLVDFLPQADAILLVSDINQQVTRSLTDFVKTMSLSKRPIYLVLTKSDTKSSSELESARKYASDNIHIDLKNICCVSANANSLDELYKLFNDIQLNKSKILKDVNEQRIKNIVSTLLSKIDDLLDSTKNDTEAEEAIRRQKYELEKLNRNIDKLIESTRDDIEECGRQTTRKFEDAIFDRLDSIAAGKSKNFDADAVSAINSTSSLILSEFKENVGSLLRKKAQEKIGTDDAVNLHSLSEIDLSQYSINGISYNLSLNTVGHEYDGYIATGVKVAAAVAAVATAAAALPAAGGVAAAGGAAEAASAAIDASTIVDLADTVTDIGSIVSNRNTINRISEFADRTSDKYTNIQNYNENIGQQVGAGKGIVESLVGLATDAAMGKPQRRRAIHEYMDGTLLPQFKSAISGITTSLTGLIRNCLRQEASNSIEEMSNALNELQRVKKERVEEYNNRISKLRDYKNELSII
jgi:GTPase SAR1 family protein